MSTMKRVAERAGVSAATVSRVVNKSGFVAPPLQKVVMEAMEALRYHPSAVARGLRTRETHSIGVLVPQLSQPFFSSLAYAIERTLFNHAYRAFLCSAEEDAAEESAYIDMLLGQRVGGLILVPTGQSMSKVQRVLEAKVCVILVDRDLPTIKIDHVLSDNFNGAYKLARHLIDLGHRRIGIISSPQRSGSIARRLAGINHAFQEAGIRQGQRLFAEGPLEQFEFGFSVTQEFLQSSRPPTAVIALTDTTSLCIFMGTVVRSMPQFGILLILVLLPLQMLSGGQTPRESMPELVQYIMLVAPTTHYVMLAQAILYRAAGIEAVWPNFLGLAAIGGALFAFSRGRLRKSLSEIR